MIFHPIETAPLDGTAVLARWTATEHGNQYAVVRYCANETIPDWFDGDIPVRCMDSWCELPL
jgi:hypothetical protein